MIRAVVIMLAIAACGADPTPTAITFSLTSPTDPAEAQRPEYDQALAGWRSIGIVRVDADADVDVTIERVPSLVVDGHRTQAASDRDARQVWVDADLEAGDPPGAGPFRFLVAVAHEVGHVVLDTPTHTSCGIMAGADVVPCDEDRALACETVGAGCN